MKRIYVIAGTHQEFLSYESKHASPDIIYHNLVDTKSLIGTMDPDGVLIGSWRSRKDIMEILTTLNQRMISKSKRDRINSIVNQLYGRI